MNQGMMRMPHKTLTFWEFIIAAVLIGAAWPIGQALASERTEEIKYVVGRVILQIIFTMSAGLIYFFNNEPHPMAVLAIACVLNVVGMETARLLGIAYVKTKHGIPDKDVENDSQKG